MKLGKQASRGAAAVGALLSVACLAAPRGIFGQTFQVPPRSTVAGLPAANTVNPGRLITVTDGATATDCATGGGSNVVLCLDRGASGWTSVRSSASGTVTSVSVTTANGVSATVANSTTTPALTLSLGAITPTSVAASGNVTGANLSGTNTGDQTNISGNAATATALAADPANCSTPGDFAVGIAASGAAQCATPSGGGGGVGGSTGATDRAVLIASGTGGSTLQASAARLNADGSEFTLGGSIVGRFSLGSGAPWLRGVATTAWGGNAATYLQVGANLDAIMLTGFSAAVAYWHVGAHGMLVSPTQTNQPAMGTGLALLEVNSTTDGNAGRVVARVQGKTGQSVDYLQVRNGSGADLVKVTSAGVLESTIAARLTPQSSPPFTCESATEGSIYYDSTDHGQCSCEGATPSWVSRSGGSCN